MSCKLFKALFPFQGLNEGTLTFKQNDLLTVIQPVDQNWHFGCLGDACGFIPVKYVKEVEDKDCSYMAASVSACIAKLQAIPDKKATKDEHSALKKLTKCRDALQAELSAAKLAKQQHQPAAGQQKQQQPGQQKQQPGQGRNGVGLQPQGKQQQQQLPANLSRLLVDRVRASTRGSHRSCVEAVGLVLATLGDHLTGQSEELASLIGQLSEQMAVARTADLPEDEDYDSTDSPDWQALDRLLSMADKRRLDWQERGGWPLHEHEGQVRDELLQLADLLTSADSVVARRRVRFDGCAAPLCLAELYAAETRPSIRQGLMLCLAAMCTLDRMVVNALLGHSSLATDLMRDTGTDLLRQSLHLLAMLFSCPVRPTTAVVDALDQPLFSRLFVHLASDDLEEPLAQAIVTFVLAANNLPTGSCERQQPVQERPQFRALIGTPLAAHAFTGAILVLFNWAKDPTALLEHSPPRCDSVVKMLTDLFSADATAAVFFSNDINVMLDVIDRELLNSSPDSKTLLPFLQLLERCVATARYKESGYRSADLLKALKQLSEQDEAPEPVREQCRAISRALSMKGVLT